MSRQDFRCIQREDTTYTQEPESHPAREHVHSHLDISWMYPGLISQLYWDIFYPITAAPPQHTLQCPSLHCTVPCPLFLRRSPGLQALPWFSQPGKGVIL